MTSDNEFEYANEENGCAMCGKQCVALHHSPEIDLYFCSGCKTGLEEDSDYDYANAVPDWESGW